MIVAFDFDNTLMHHSVPPTSWHPMKPQLSILNALLDRGDSIYIVTARCVTISRLGLESAKKKGKTKIVCEGHHHYLKRIFFDMVRKGVIPIMEDFLETYVPKCDQIKGVYYTDGFPKGELLKELGVQVLIDDSKHKRAEALEQGIDAFDPKDVSQIKHFLKLV